MFSPYKQNYQGEDENWFGFLTKKKVQWPANRREGDCQKVELGEGVRWWWGHGHMMLDGGSTTLRRWHAARSKKGERRSFLGFGFKSV